MLSDKILEFLLGLEFRDPLPDGIQIMNPFRDDPGILPVVSQFYHKYYDDNDPRYLILGINPGRFGAGVTGIPFTDSKRLRQKCGLSIPHLNTFETSSVFIYEMIDTFGGPSRFYHRFFISAVSPLGLTSLGKSGKHINYNYYDNDKLLAAMHDFIIENLKRQISLGIERDLCFCLGTGKNYKFISEVNKKHKFFGEIVPLEHPRFIMQYRLKQKEDFIEKYIEMFRKVENV